MLKKIILTLLASLVLFQSTLSPVFAQVSPQGGWYDTDIRDWYIKVYDQTRSPASEIFGERYTAAQTQWVVYSLIAIIINLVFDSTFTACILGQTGQASAAAGACVAASSIPQRIRTFGERFFPQGAANNNSSQEKLADSGNIVSHFVNMTIANRGSSGINYLKNTFNKITLVPVANAQEGFGYGELDVLREFWTKSRDISYGLLIFAAIILAFMIMFRTKISPQTVISAQSAIPKLIAAIILITFSYAIAGFLVDLVYVVVGLIAAVFTNNAQDLERAYRFMTAGPGNVGIFGVLGLYVVVFPVLFALSFIGSTFNPFDFWGGSGAVPSILGIVIIILVFVVTVIVLLLAYIRTLFLLIRSLINIYLAVVFAPFYMVFGTVTPAMGFGPWIRTMITNLAVFPAIGLMFLLAIEFMRQGAQAALGQLQSQELTDAMNWIFSAIGLGVLEPFASGGGWSPPLLDIGAGGLLLQFVSLSIITLIPNIGNIIQGFFSGRPFAYGTGIGEAFGPIRSGAGAGRTLATARVIERMEHGLPAGGNWMTQGLRRITGIRG